MKNDYNSFFVFVALTDCWSLFSFGHDYSALKFSILDSNACDEKTVLRYPFELFSSFLFMILIVVVSHS